jgi:hypothetical protein
VKSIFKLTFCSLLTLCSAHATEKVFRETSSTSDVGLTEVTVTGTVKSEKSITATKCASLGDLSAGEIICLNECPIAQSLQAGRNITIHQSKVLGDVSAGSDVQIEDSTVEETLSCYSNYLVLNESQISAIELKCIKNFFTDLFRSKKETSQILELHNCTVHDITFEGGNGEVILFGKSTVTGTITGGKIQTQK